MQTDHDQLFLWVALLIVFKVKWGQTESQAIGRLIKTLLSLSVIKSKEGLDEGSSHPAFCNTENHKSH